MQIYSRTYLFHQHIDAVYVYFTDTKQGCQIAFISNAKDIQ